ncbi:MAG: low-specificity L-threonine aldolase [Nitrospiraceae bacterium]|nr:low-specificity L-threonine aldolase [Nitrospiraceae bacterium]
MRFIDLRSDTVTQPTPEMRAAMATAPVGDDVYGEDPTVNRLEAEMAARLGKEAGLFVASGTMGNLVSILAHAGRGDEMILGDLAHTFLYEAGGAAALGGIHPHPIHNAPDGSLPLDEIKAAIREDDVHFPPTRLICLENTHNRCGGYPLSPEYCDAVGALAHSRGIAVHLDGARLFNAAVALGVDPRDLTRSVDSVMVCLSKGLGAPVGSVVCGTREFIAQARRMRKIVGGGMRQAGIIAAAGLYALEHHIDRLADDHTNAARLAAGISGIAGLELGPDRAPGQEVKTNLVYFRITRPGLDAATLTARLHARGVLGHPIGPGTNQMRLATHLNVTTADIDAAIAALQSAVSET